MSWFSLQPSALAIAVGFYLGAGALVMAATAEQLRQRRWPVVRALAVSLPLGLLWPLTIGVMTLLKALQPEG